MDQGTITIIAVVVSVVFILIAVTRTFAKGGTAQKASRNFAGDLEKKTGLKTVDDHFEGRYKDLEYWVKISISMNAMDPFHLVGHAGRMAMYPKLKVRATAAGKSFPHTVLKQDLNILVSTDQRIHDWVTGKHRDLPGEIKSLDKQLPRISVYGADENFARRFTGDFELKRLLSDWYYADISIEGDEIFLLLDNEMVLRKYMTRLQSPGYIVQAMDIVARIGQLAK